MSFPNAAVDETNLTIDPFGRSNTFTLERFLLETRTKDTLIAICKFNSLSKYYENL